MGACLVGIVAAAVLVTTARTTMAQATTIASEMKVETAVVEAIDTSTRTITLRRPDGTLVSIVAGPEVKRFAEIKVGDKVTARYYDNVVVRLRRPGDPEVDSTAKTTTSSERVTPGGTKARQRTITATITAINRDLQSITFTGPNGWKYFSKVQDMAALDKVKVGETVDVVWTEAMLVSIDSGSAQQTAPAPDAKTQGAIDCGAAVGDRNTCDADTSSGVVLVRQTGDGNCALGRTWGFDAKGVWVADGCRGTFVFSDDRVTVTCSAVAGAREVCEANTTAGVALVTGSPACMPGRTWGYDRDGI
jgi:hypothetical protein